MDTSVVKRLAFIKYVFELGNTQSSLPEPAGSASILMFHDSVELFLDLACEYIDVGKKQINFMEYWDLISPKFSSGLLPQKESMRRLNKSRVDLKHHGLLPSKLDIESFRKTTSNFFIESTPLIFNIEFSDISLIDFVSEENVRQYLHEATELLSSGDLITASEKTSIAFHVLVDDYEARKRSQYGRSPFNFGEDFTFFDSFSMGLGFGSNNILATRDLQRKLGEFVDKVAESLEAMKNAIRIIAMRIDYPKYSKFLMVTPSIRLALDGQYHVRHRQGFSITEEDVKFCIDFVIETALKLQEFDYSISRV